MMRRRKQNMMINIEVEERQLKNGDERIKIVTTGRVTVELRIGLNRVLNK